ncbi:transcriptional regulator [Pontibacillus halophilus JSM 076056 = DSM 19796]|uniref:Transcriptional regulator n=1 Tax=Pontibacillus halophilus JSM 076056 = DSM 19796 TaxID=1385510 RepID=A0A0A5ID61_9BACI|nr:transcription repressor NadR [Pontibacillus halophilus]KGX93777.1 transcriptional regulator [Pontibacillus halophilus JSM 076056 = DSM 19796]
MSQSKVLGEERRSRLLSKLKQAQAPIKGSEFAKQFNVSRQVIVGDVSLLKAKNEPIVATSQGYLYIRNEIDPVMFERSVVCSHTSEQTAEELTLLVDHGVLVKDVSIEHPLYGDLTASLHLHNRKEVAAFVEKAAASGATYLLELTEGIHLHTIAARTEEDLDRAIRALDEAGFLVQ